MSLCGRFYHFVILLHLFDVVLFRFVIVLHLLVVAP